MGEEAVVAYFNVLSRLLAGDKHKSTCQYNQAPARVGNYYPVNGIQTQYTSAKTIRPVSHLASTPKFDFNKNISANLWPFVLRKRLSHIGTEDPCLGTMPRGSRAVRIFNLSIL